MRYFPPLVFVLKKVKPRKHRVFGLIQRAYTKMLRGALKVKILVLLAAIGLLAFTVNEVLDMPISFMPSVNSEQMSASLSFNDPDMPDDEQQDVNYAELYGIHRAKQRRDKRK